MGGLRRKSPLHHGAPFKGSHRPLAETPAIIQPDLREQKMGRAGPVKGRPHGWSAGGGPPGAASRPPWEICPRPGARALALGVLQTLASVDKGLKGPQPVLQEQQSPRQHQEAMCSVNQRR